jgi:hypothetical protein
MPPVTLASARHVPTELIEKISTPQVQSTHRRAVITPQR